MTEQTKLALVNFTGLVATAIARQAEGKDVHWREIVDAQEALANAILTEPESPAPPTV